MPAREVKFTALDLKGVEADGIFEGYASLFHQEDWASDVVHAGRLPRQPRRARPATASRCCSSTIRTSRSACGSKLDEDARGLYVRGRLMPEVAQGARGARA